MLSPAVLGLVGQLARHSRTVRAGLYTLVVHFDEARSQEPAEDFVTEVLVDALLPVGGEGTVIALVLSSVLVGAPFAYVLSGVVLASS